MSRTPRKAVLRSLVRDLETSEQNIRASFVGSSTPLRISPFRIVRVVDREGDIRAIRSAMHQMNHLCFLIFTFLDRTEKQSLSARDRVITEIQKIALNFIVA